MKATARRWIDIGISLPGLRVTALLDQLVALHGARMIRCDDGPELLSRALTRWCDRQGVLVQHIQPGKANQNAYIERFNLTYRRVVLDAFAFRSLADVRAETEAWLLPCSTRRPDDSRGGR
jgi:putative transposase